MLIDRYTVRTVRRAADYTAQRLADEMGFSVGYIRQIETGKKPITKQFEARFHKLAGYSH